MSIKISIKKSISPKLVKNYVLFCDENFKINGLDSLSLKSQYLDINKATNINKTAKKDFLIFNINSTQKILLIKIKNNNSTVDNEKTGARFFNFIKNNSIFDLSLFNNNIKATSKKNIIFLDEFLHGVQLKSYTFKKYKSKKNKEIFYFNISSDNKSINYNKNKRFSSLIEGTILTKDLVSEPGNILHPDEYAKRLKKLKNVGLKVVIYDNKKLKKLGMNALLGVGQGSIRGSYLVTLEWK